MWDTQDERARDYEVLHPQWGVLDQFRDELVAGTLGEDAPVEGSFST